MSGFASFTRTDHGDEWFDVYQITPNLFAIHEPGHFEEPISSLLIGDQRAALIDTGCGIGDLRRVVRALTDLPVVVINTHTHIDHLGGNHQFDGSFGGSFDGIAMFDHPRTRSVAKTGIPAQQRQTEILADHLMSRPLPATFDPGDGSLPPFAVERWLSDGDRIDLGGRELEVIHTPGEAPDHICLLDRADGILFSGDILLEGPVWTHLEGGSLSELVDSYRRLMTFLDDFEHVMPSHNAPWLDRELLPKTLTGAEAVLAGSASGEPITDPWKRQLVRYAFDQFEILTPAK